MKKSIGYRIFLVRGDDALPLSKTTFEDFLFGRRAVLQNFAGQTVDIATVVCRLENKKPKEIVRFYCQRFKVKSDGSIDEAHNQKRSVPAATLDRALVRNTGSREKTTDPNDSLTRATPGAQPCDDFARRSEENSRSAVALSRGGFVGGPISSNAQHAAAAAQAAPRADADSRADESLPRCLHHIKLRTLCSSDVQ